jgi:hypothetical protein
MIDVTCACGLRFAVPEDKAGLRGRCYGCGASVLIPTPYDPKHDCPHCREPIEPPPKHRRKCPHCREWVNVSRGDLVTRDELYRRNRIAMALAVASKQLLPCAIVDTPTGRHVVREITEFMPPEPPDDHPYSGSSSPNLEIDGAVLTMGIGGGSTPYTQILRRGRTSGFYQVVTNQDGVRERRYTDGRVEVEPASTFQWDPEISTPCGFPLGDDRRCQNKVKGGGCCHLHEGKVPLPFMMR